MKKQHLRIAPLVAGFAALLDPLAAAAGDPTYHNNCSSYQFRTEVEDSINYWRAANGLPELVSIPLSEADTLNATFDNKANSYPHDSPQDAAWDLLSHPGLLNSPDAYGFDITVTDYGHGEYQVTGDVWTESLEHATAIQGGPAARVEDNPVAFETEFRNETICVGTLSELEVNGSGDGNPEGYPTWPSGHDLVLPPSGTPSAPAASPAAPSGDGDSAAADPVSDPASGSAADPVSAPANDSTAGVLRPSAPFAATVDTDADAARVWRLYTTYFLRQPDAGGFDYWRDTLTAGVGLGSVSDAFVLSEEFQRRYGTLSNAEFVERVYGNVLKRGSDAAGREYWIGLLDSDQMTRGNMMLYFSESDEYLLATGTGHGLFDGVQR